MKKYIHRYIDINTDTEIEILVDINIGSYISVYVSLTYGNMLNYRPI